MGTGGSRAASWFLVAALNRTTSGYAAIVAALLIALWFASGRSGSDRRRWAIPMAVAALIPLVISCAINRAKFGVLFGVPFSDELLIQIPR